MSEYNELVRVAVGNWNSEIRRSDANPRAIAYNEAMDILIQCIQCGASAIALVGKGYCGDCAKSMKAPVPPSRVNAVKAVEKFKATSQKSTQDLIREVCDTVKEILVDKNIAYGDSALNPVRIFSSASPDEQLRVRIDDKLSRIARGHALDEDIVLDLIGYLILLKVQRLREVRGHET
jgi:hypothetical protein